jgi:signal transduction histidine kinase
MAISMAIFGTHQRVYRISFVILSALLLASLFITDFDLIGPFQIESANENTFFLINLYSSALILVVCINFIIGVNEESERRLHTLANEVKIKNNNLEKTNAELDRFLYSTSHDLRSPLLSIMGLVNIARNETADAVVRKYLTMMEDRVNRLDLFIKDIIDYSRNTRTGVNREIFSVHQLIDEVMQNFQFLDGASSIDFQSEILVNEVFADRGRIAVILNNLISNSIKYHRIDRTIPWVKISIHHSDNKLIIVVADNGQGIHPDRVDKIFDMFYRGTERSQGSGLGLDIVKEAIEKMSGTVRVESIEHEGTAFYITIPLNSSENSVAPESEIKPQLELSRNSTFVVLVV